MSPKYLGDASADELARMITGLTQELWILRDRVMTLEQLRDDKGVVSVADVETHVPEQALDERLRRERTRIVRRVLGAPLTVATR